MTLLYSPDIVVSAEVTYMPGENCTSSGLTLVTKQLYVPVSLPVTLSVRV